MPANEYYFVSHWRVPCTPAEAYDIIQDTAALPHWWPSAFIESQPHYFEDGVEGVALATKGWMPYILHWTVRELSSDPPGSLVIEVRGDFNGRGIWTLMPDGDWTDITYDWRIRVEKPGVKQLSFLLKPLFESNHRWAMKKGEESLRLELARRRAPSEAARNAIEPPPGPTQIPVLPIAGTLALFLLWKFRPRRKKTRREQAQALVAGTAATVGAGARTTGREARRTARKAEKELRKNARRAQRDLGKRSGRARERLGEAIERATHENGVPTASRRVEDTLQHADVRNRADVLRERIEAALEKSDVPERIGALWERVEQAIEASDLPERLEAVKERAERAIDKSYVPERLAETRKRARGLLRGRSTRSSQRIGNG